MLPASFMDVFGRRDRAMRWVRTSCQNLHLKVLEGNLSESRLIPGEQSKRPHVDPDLRNDSGQTLMHATVLYLDNDPFQEQYLWSLLQNGANPNLTDPYKKTPLMYCVLDAKIKLLRILSNHPRTDLTVKDSNGNTALSLAAISGNMDVCKVLCKAVVHRNKFSVFIIKNNDGFTPENLAVDKGLTPIAELLNSERIKVLKEVTRERRDSEYPLEWPDVVMAIVAAKRWMRAVRRPVIL